MNTNLYDTLQERENHEKHKAAALIKNVYSSARKIGLYNSQTSQNRRGKDDYVIKRVRNFVSTVSSTHVAHTCVLKAGAVGFLLCYSPLTTEVPTR